MDTDPLDHRWATRKPGHLSATIRGDKLEIIDCVAEDISWGGAFIKTVRTKQLQQDDVIELSFYIQKEAGPTEYKITARVARCLEEGYGFEFTKFNIATFLIIRKLRKALKS